MFISREEKEKLNSEIAALKQRVAGLELYANTLTNLFKEEIDKRMGEELTRLVGKLCDDFNKLVKPNKTETKTAEKIETIERTKGKRNRDSILKQYYKKYNLNLAVKNFKKIKDMNEIDVATLLYLYDQYKYLSEVKKHIGLAENTLKKYTSILKTNGYLIYNNGMGRVANGCLVYKKESK